MPGHELYASTDIRRAAFGPWGRRSHRVRVIPTRRPIRRRTPAGREAPAGVDCRGRGHEGAPHGREHLRGQGTRPAGFEPAASASGGRRSIQLSYGRSRVSLDGPRVAPGRPASRLPLAHGPHRRLPRHRRLRAHGPAGDRLRARARLGGDRLLFDCGEGAQRQMQRSTGLVQVDEIYITHFHADHYLGLPACSRPTTSRGASAAADHRPARPRELFKALRRIVGPARLRRRAGRAGRRGGDPARGLRGARLPRVDHRVPRHGYALVEDDPPGALRRRTRRRALGVARSRLRPAAGGEEVTGTEAAWSARRR